MTVPAEGPFTNGRGADWAAELACHDLTPTWSDRNARTADDVLGLATGGEGLAPEGRPLVKLLASGPTSPRTSPSAATTNDAASWRIELTKAKGTVRCAFDRSVSTGRTTVLPAVAMTGDVTRCAKWTTPRTVEGSTPGDTRAGTNTGTRPATRSRLADARSPTAGTRRAIVRTRCVTEDTWCCAAATACFTTGRTK